MMRKSEGSMLTADKTEAILRRRGRGVQPPPPLSTSTRISSSSTSCRGSWLSSSSTGILFYHLRILTLLISNLYKTSICVLPCSDFQFILCQAPTHSCNHSLHGCRGGNMIWDFYSCSPATQGSQGIMANVPHEVDSGYPFESAFLHH